jgi:hypothetical protein
LTASAELLCAKTSPTNRSVTTRRRRVREPLNALFRMERGLGRPSANTPGGRAGWRQVCLCKKRGCTSWFCGGDRSRTARDRSRAAQGVSTRGIGGYGRPEAVVGGDIDVLFQFARDGPCHRTASRTRLPDAWLGRCSCRCHLVPGNLARRTAHREPALELAVPWWLGRQPQWPPPVSGDGS